MEYTATFVRYERTGNRVVPVRVTKSWVTAEGMRGQLKTKAFKATRVTELRRMPNGDREQAPEAWESSRRVESRERLMTLMQRDTEEPMLQEAGYDQYTLPLGRLDNLSWAQANAPMDAEPDTREWFTRQQWAELRGHSDDDAQAAA